VEGRGKPSFPDSRPGVSIDKSNLNQCIAKLRKELGEPAEEGVIETVARRGYRLACLFNAFHVVFAAPQTSITTADFGRIRLSQVNIPRQIQFGLRFVY
jgi:DNA-binding winged helix-turn-helix (wHTH) protein